MRAQSLILFNLLFYLSSTCSSPLPPRLNHPDLHDWIQPYQSGNLLFAFNLSNDTRLVPSIGNGYLATVFESDTLFISGIYNGNVTEARPSHRARIPGFASMVWQHPDEEILGFALDMANSSILRRSLIHGVLVERKTYAHRAIRSLVVNQVELTRKQGTELEAVALNAWFNKGSDSEDLEILSSSNGQHLVRTVREEVPGSGFVEIGICSSLINEQLILPANVDSAKFTFITSFKTSLESSDPLQDACKDLKYGQNLENLFDYHVQSYQSVISPSGFEIGGDLALSQVVNASLYYILSSIRSDWDFSLSPGGLASNSYNGHVFWDAETWMYPPLLILHPEIAASMIRYRFNTRNGAIDKALSYKSNYKGTMFAWESAFTGQETCPLSAPTGQLEQHISADVAFAVIQYWRMSGDIFWLKNVGYSLLEGICEFYASRVEKDANNESFSINGVIPPDEYAVHKNNSAYTNAGVKIIMSETTKIAKLLQIQSPAEWSDIAENLVVPSDEKQNIHLEYDGYKGEQIKQADVILLGFPWEFPMSDSRKRSDLDFYMNVTDSENGPAMTWGMAMVGYLSLGDSPKQVEDLFKKSYLNVQGDFNVWFEVPYGGAVNFITGAGGFLQTIPFGWAGMRIYDDNLSFNPQLAPSTDSMKLRGVAYQGSRFNVEWNQETVTINSIDDQKFKVKANNKEYVLKGGKDLTFARSSFSVSSLNDNVFI